MARARGIKPQFFSDVDLAEKCSRDARLLFIGLWTMADFRGVLKHQIRGIKREVFPYDDDLPIESIAALLRELIDGGFVAEFTVNSDRYLHVSQFQKHQHPTQKERLSGTDLPAPPNGANPDRTRIESGANPDRTQTYSLSPPERLITDNGVLITERECGGSSEIEPESAADPLSLPESTEPTNVTPISKDRFSIPLCGSGSELWPEMLDACAQLGMKAPGQENRIRIQIWAKLSHDQRDNALKKTLEKARRSETQVAKSGLFWYFNDRKWDEEVPRDGPVKKSAAARMPTLSETRAIHGRGSG